ncbi:hypothetical protein BDY19DRAFT_991945 [Irpex rosettiformis]|uniref:Uncharacterized protein n=1 Tax=Irpex rosettiformis TaxID=378272 RepID=A0ACB8U8E4_9APHY|nr:hypothetical protein BDY19DRAFT_991945 [Irpex rosettiformis]
MLKRQGPFGGFKNLGSGKPVGAPKNNDKTVMTKAVMKAVLQTTVEISDVFPPLKSVVVGLNIVIEYVEKTGINQTDLENLLGRITRIKETFVVRLGDDSNNTEGLDGLTKELETIYDGLKPLQHQSRFKRIFMSSDNAGVIQEYIVKVEKALGDYQLSLLQDLYKEHISHDERTTLDSLPRAKDAGFDAGHERPGCLTGTRVEILHTLRRWASDPRARQVYWMNGYAGSGKSTIAQSFAEWLSSQHKLGASFFCSRESQLRSDYKMIIPTLAYQLAKPSHPASSKYRKALLRALKKNPDIASLTLQNQLDELIVKPVTDSKMTTILLIDALDECRDNNSTSILLSFLAEIVEHIPSLKFFITGRPETHIQSGFRLGQLHPITDVMILHEVGADTVEQDIRLFLGEKLSSIARLRADVDIPKGWPKKRDIDALTAKADGLFIFASTAVKFIHAKRHDPTDRLRMLLRSGTVHEGSTGLDELYLRILRDAFAEDSDEFVDTFRSVLGLLVVSCDLLRATTIAEILGISLSNVKTSLRFLHSVLVIPDDPTRHLRFLHKSFPDFLTNPLRCSDARFFINTDIHHFEVAQRCFELMKSSLKKNICNLPRYSMNEDLTPAQRDKCISDTTRYSCKYWADHLLADGARNAHLDDIKPSLQQFIATQQLLWFEVLSLLHELRRAVDSLDRVYDWLVSLDDPPHSLAESVKDGQRFILFGFDGIQQSVAHIYHSTIPLSPHDALLRQSVEGNNSSVEAKAVIGPERSWSNTSHTIQMSNWVRTVEYSHDGTVFAAGGNGFSHLFQSGTGERLAEFDTFHPEWIHSLSFSLDDQVLATAPDKCVRLWDVRTGVLLAEVPEHQDHVMKVAFHPSNKDWLLSIDECGRVFLWDIGSEKPRCRVSFTVEGANGKACWRRHHSVTTLLLGTRFGCIEEWRVDSKPTRLRLFLPEENVLTVRALASSHDGSLVALGSDDRIVIYNVDNATIRSSVVMKDTGPLLSLTFAPSTNVLLYGAMLGMGLYFPERKDGRIVSLPVHSDFVRCSTFSPDSRFIASGSDDKTVKILEAQLEDPDYKMDDTHHKFLIRSAHFSVDGRYVVSGSVDHTVRVWSASDGTLLRTLEGHSSWVYAATFLGSNSEYVISREVKGTMLIWDWVQDKVIYRDLVLYNTYGHFQRDFPYTHGPLGFFSINEAGGECNVWCWLIERDRGADGVHLRLVSSGSLPSTPNGDYIARLYHQTAPSDSSVSVSALTLLVECASGARFVASWRHFEDTLTFPDSSPEILTFLVDTDRQSDTINAHDKPWFIGIEKPCRQSEGNAWILDDDGRKIFWVPPVHRGFGRWYEKKLLLQANDIIVSLHNPSGAPPSLLQSGVEIRQGDYTQPSTLDSAFAGGDKLLLISYPSIAYTIRVQSHIAAIDAAKRVGIKHIYYTSLMFAGDSQADVMQAHLATERYLKESGVGYTVVREGIYSESWALYFGYWNPDRGSVVKVPYGDGGVAWVCREDLGEGTARVMVEDTYVNQTIRFTGSKAWTLSELAQLISTTLKLETPLKLEVVSLEEFKKSNSGDPWSGVEALGVSGDAGESALKQYNK